MNNRINNELMNYYDRVSGTDGNKEQNNSSSEPQLSRD